MSAEEKKELPIKFAVRSIIFDRQLQVLLTKRADGNFEAGKWCLPGGVLEEGEDPSLGATRENIEEMNLPITLYPYGTFENPDTYTNEVWITHYHVGFTSKLPTQLKEDEIAEVGFFNEAQIKDLDIVFGHKDIVLKLLQALKT